MNLSYIPSPDSPDYQELGEVRRRLCRVLYYIAIQYNYYNHGAMTWSDYRDVYDLLLAAWKKINADSEFEEQIPVV